MLIAIIALSVLLLISIFAIFSYRRQINHICRQLNFKNKHNTNLTITSVSGGRSFYELVKLLNDNFNKQEKIINEYRNNDNSLKETITNLSHDIRTPLTSLDGYFQILRECENEDDKEHYYTIIDGRISALKDMLEEQFTYAKLQDVSFELDMESISINKMLLDTAFGFYEDFKSRGIEPIFDVKGEDMYIFANSGALKRVLQNIIKNAISHGEQNVEIHLKKQDNKAVLQIANQYNSLDKIDETKVFDRFYKADASRTRTSTGLELSIAKELVDKMNGNIFANKNDKVFIITIEFELIN